MDWQTVVDHAIIAAAIVGVAWAVIWGYVKAIES